MSKITNTNPTTGIAYGYISANALDSDLVNTLMDNGIDRIAQDACEEWKRERAFALVESGEHDDIEDAEDSIDDSEFWETYDTDERNSEGEHEGVVYATSWLGGALNFFIFDSPVTTDHARLASPCVPNAGILDTLDGSVTSYNVPDDWRRCED